MLTRLTIELIRIFREVLFFSDVIGRACYYFIFVSSFGSYNSSLLLIIESVNHIGRNIFLFITNDISQVIYFLVTFRN